MTDHLNKEISLVVSGEKVIINTQRKVSWKELVLFPLPYFVIFTLVFSLKKELASALLLSLAISLFISSFFIFYRILTSQFYWHFVFDLKAKRAFKKSFHFGKEKKSIDLIWNDEQLYLRDVSRSGWKSCALTYWPDIKEDERLSLLIIKQESAIQKIQHYLNLPYHEKKNKKSFFDN